VVADGSLELRMGRGGHYGERRGGRRAHPVLVDTGASVTAIPRHLGERIGIRECAAIGFDLSAANEPGCCRKQTFRTANGTTEGCVGRVPSLRFGPFEVRNASVAVMPGMGEQALLGMNVLKHFNLVQEGGA
jgi:clan AA aspartic protease (TIGR02281 family)